jgi:hypothetical protein
MASSVPNLPPISSIQDPAVRSYLQALTAAWQIRNGQTRETDEKFVTVGELTNGIKLSTQGGSPAYRQNFGNSTPGMKIDLGIDLQISNAFDTLAQKVTESELFKELGSRIGAIEQPDWGRINQGSYYNQQMVRIESEVLAKTAEINTYTARLNDSIAYAQTEIKTVATELSATASELTMFQTNVADNIAQAKQEVIVQSDSRYASAGTFTDLAVKVNGPNGTDAKAREALELATYADNKVRGAWTVKLDAQGYIAGVGLEVTGSTATPPTSPPRSEFAVRADRFVIGPPATPTTPANLNPLSPFMHLTSPQTIDGKLYQAGTHMRDAFIEYIDAGKIVAGSLSVGQYIQSANYVAGSTGWKINADGSAEFGNVTVRGNVAAGSITGYVATNQIANNAVSNVYGEPKSDAQISVPNGYGTLKAVPGWVSTSVDTTGAASGSCVIIIFSFGADQVGDSSDSAKFSCYRSNGVQIGAEVKFKADGDYRAFCTQWVDTAPINGGSYQIRALRVGGEMICSNVVLTSIFVKK